jgi:glyoxylase-like metal-dependent hydrolase (beta-lactamase superfamily II)
MSSSPRVESFFHEPTSTWSHVAWDPATGIAVIIDPVLDYDPESCRTDRSSVEALIGFVREQDLSVIRVLETHAHADHLTASAVIHETLGCPMAIGRGICQVQRHFRAVFDLGDSLPADGSQFQELLDEDDRIALGEMELRVMSTPGHTNDSVTYLIGDAAFIGDTLFTPGYGTARCDFPGGDARLLYQSIRRIFALGDGVRLYLCHDYPEPGQTPRPMTTVAEQRSGNVHVRDGIGEDQFVAMREERDADLAVPALILPAIQVNIRAGRLPDPATNGVSYLKLPLNQL